MLRRPSLAFALTGCGLLVSACTIKTPDDGNPKPTGPETGGSTSADGGEPAEPGRAGRGGSQAGGRGGAQQTGGRAGAPEAGEGGAGGQPPEDACPAECEGGDCVGERCVECVPSRDRCALGTYCTADYVCVPGCKDADSCASGLCGEDRNCEKCIDDRECTDGFLCSAGTCARACTADAEGTGAGCSGELTCCAERCADLTTESNNCGACGNACEAGQFCGKAACGEDGEGSCSECHDTTLASVCSVAKVVVILDTNKNPEDGDRAPGLAMGNALAAECPTKPELIEAMQDSVEALNLKTGRPVSNSSELLVIAGGPFFQDLEGYLEEQRVSPLYFYVGTDTTEYRLTKTDEAVVSMPIDADHDSRDAFIIQFMRDPDSGSLVLNAQGLWLSGTVAAAYQLTNGLLPNLSQQDQAWYAYEWSDLDGDKAPDLDEIVLVSSGK